MEFEEVSTKTITANEKEDFKIALAKWMSTPGVPNTIVDDVEETYLREERLAIQEESGVTFEEELPVTQSQLRQPIGKYQSCKEFYKDRNTPKSGIF